MDKGLMPSGTCGAYSAIMICKRLGFKKIAFAGQDLAYADDGRVYCDDISKEGNTVEEQRKKQNGYTTYVKDYSGKDILSNIIWKDQLTGFEIFIKVNSNIEVYDATEGGALIEGAKIITLEKYIKDNKQNQLEDFNLLVSRERNKLKEPKLNVIKDVHEKLLAEYKYFLEIQDLINGHFNNLMEINNEYVIKNRNFSQPKIEKAVGIINISQKIIDKIIGNDFLMLYYQGLIATFKKEINQIGKQDFEKSLRLHIQIHFDFFNLINPVYKLNLDCMKFILEVLEAKINNKPHEDDIIQILRKIVKDNGIDPDSIYDYYRVEKEERI